MDPFTIAALGGAAASGLSGIMGAGAARQAGAEQSNAAMMSALIQAQQAQAAREQQERMYRESVERMEPFRQGGVAATNRMQELYGIGGNQGAAGYGSYAQPFSMADFAMDPGYAFRVQEGQKAIDRSAAANAGLQSGAALKAAARFGAGEASQEYGNAYNRFLQQRQLQLQALQGLASPGATTAGNMGQLASTTGTNIANTMIGAGTALGQGIEQAGQARASSYMGGQSALQGALSGIGENAMAAALYNRRYPAANTTFDRNAGMNYGPPMPGAGGGFFLLGVRREVLEEGTNLAEEIHHGGIERHGFPGSLVSGF